MKPRLRRALVLLISLLLAVAPCALAPAQADDPPQAPQAGDEWTEPITGMEFVWVPGGCYEMGCGEWAGDECDDDEYPPHEVCVDGFWMGKYEVTIEQWYTIMVDRMFWDETMMTQYPMNHVSWEDVILYSVQLSVANLLTSRFRIPSNAEWEYACRSGGQDEFIAGGYNVDEVAWVEDNSGDKIHFVGLKNPNGVGLYDMNGNVWEWVNDTYTPESIDVHEYADSISHVIRGGSFRYPISHSSCLYQSASRKSYSDFGFRLIREK